MQKRNVQQKKEKKILSVYSNMNKKFPFEDFSHFKAALGKYEPL